MSNIGTNYTVYKNEIPFNTLKTWSEILMKNADWRFVGWAGPAKEPFRHWASYPEMEGVLKDLWDCINESLVQDGYIIKPERIVMNLYNHGDSSWTHIDSDNNTDYTVIVFMNDYWDINWGGDFALFDSDGEILQAFTPTPGKFIIFNANILHGARPVSREAPYPRFGIAFQCKNDSNIQRLQKPKISNLHTPL